MTGHSFHRKIFHSGHLLQITSAISALTAICMPVNIPFFTVHNIKQFLYPGRSGDGYEIDILGPALSDIVGCGRGQKYYDIGKLP